MSKRSKDTALINDFITYGKSDIDKCIQGKLKTKILKQNPKLKENIEQHNAKVLKSRKNRSQNKAATKLIGYSTRMADNPTLGEQVFNYGLKTLTDYKYKTQQPIITYNGGQYIVDFLVEDKVVVEIDGGYHLSDEQKKKDEKRTKNLMLDGIVRVIRFTNDEVITNLKGCIGNLKEAIDLISCNLTASNIA